MKLGAMKSIFLILLSAPLVLTASPHDDGDPPVSPIGADGGSGSSLAAIFKQAAAADPVEIEDPEALRADMDALLGTADAEPKEPMEVLDLSNE